MKRFAVLYYLSLLAAANAQIAPAPTPVAASAATVVPALVPYTGTAIAADGKPLAGDASATFLLFKDEHGGEPVWIESQTIAIDATGHYEVKLGASSSNGIPLDTFASGEARWLEVQIAGQPIPSRVLLTSVPYAIKAGDAATLGGLPVSAFVLAGTAGPAPKAPVGAVAAVSAANVTTNGGVNGYIPVFTGTSSVVNSMVFQNAVGVGIGDNPDAMLDVHGKSIFRGGQVLSRTGDATTSAGAASYPFIVQSSVYNTSNKANLLPYFQLQSEPTGNNTTTTGATFNVLYYSGVGSAPSETGLAFYPNGTIHFAPGQTFPATSVGSIAVDGTSGSGTGVKGTSTSGTGVGGSSSTGDGMLGYTAGGTLNTAGVLGQAGGASGFGGIAGVWGDAYSHVGVLGTSQLYAGVQGISTYGQGIEGQSETGYGVQGTSSTSYGVYGSSNTSNGVIGSTGGTSLYTAGVLGSAGARTSFQAIAGVWGDAAAHVGVFGSSTQYPGVAGASTSGQGVQGNSTSGTGVQGISASSYGVEGTSTAAPGVIGVSASSSGVYGVSNDTNAGDDTAGVYGYASNALPAVKGNNAGSNGPAAMFLNSSSSVPAVIGITAGGGANISAVAVYGDSAASSGIGVEGNTLSGIGVYATTNAQSTGFQLSNFIGPVALWADATPPNGDGAGIAVRATANDNNAGSFTNNSQYSTIYSYNYGSGGSGADVFNAIEAASPNGVCGFGGKGDMTCTGQVKTLATTGNGSRTVETYSMQSPENWMEDFGSGTLQNGVATVSIDAAFAETVSGSADYHVFLTPNGDSKGLYVFAKTATSFEVHESGGGTSTLCFDYRIVAKRRGFETQRMVDVTDAMKAVRTRNDLRAEQFKNAAKR